MIERKPLSPVQDRVLDFVVETIERTQNWPTCEEIADAMGWQGRSRAQHVLVELEFKGWIGRAGPRRVRVLTAHALYMERTE